MKKQAPLLSTKEKYQLYEKSVQNPSFDVTLFHRKFQKHFQQLPTILREDFGGTGYLSSKWVKKSPQHQAYAIDLDPEPIQYGKETHWAKLNPDQKKRLHYLQQDVLQSEKVKAHIVASLNFSYFIFKDRTLLKNYFTSVRKSLLKPGFFVLDIFGGTECHMPLEERTDHPNHSYYWDCDSFNPISNECLYKIHFKKNGERHKYTDVFVYDWRHWTIPELRDILIEAGFKEVLVYWEGDDDKGGGNGVFNSLKAAENCESWVSYLLAIP